jgi:hypothetical protein
LNYVQSKSRTICRKLKTEPRWISGAVNKTSQTIQSGGLGESKGICKVVTILTSIIYAIMYNKPGKYNLIPNGLA